MKIVILGLITVVFTNVAMASPSDKGGKDDMILEQMKDLRHQLQQQQHVIKELKEEQERCNEDQRYEMEELKKKQERRDQEQERRDQEQERRVEEVTKVQRARRSENETVEHLKELVLAEIKPMIDDLSVCVVGEAMFENPTPHIWSFGNTETIPFGRSFTQTPKVVVSLQGYRLASTHFQSPIDMFIYGEARSITTTQFDLFMVGYYTKMRYIRGTWVACG